MQRRLAPGVDTNMLTAQDVLVRDAVGTDADAIAAIGSEAMPAQYAGLVDPAAVAAVVSQAYEPSAVTECIDRCQRASDALFLVAERSGQVVGFLHFDSFGPEPELHRLYLEHRHRGAGIGTLLMNGLHARLPAESRTCFSWSPATTVPCASTNATAFMSRASLTVSSTTASGWALCFPLELVPSVWS